MMFSLPVYNNIFRLNQVRIHPKPKSGA
ncbi:hypothetical protein NC652_017122 [Populus alba x Populus x berolinensis]|nr:hypothetical protein NC652_017122 [Populus alba x Populus x berolinensis]